MEVICLTHSVDHPSRAIRGAVVSIVAYLFLSFLKIAGGLSFDSRALLADGFNNTTDIIASVAVFIGLRIAARPKDEDHPYGHQKMESIAAMIASLIMLSVGLAVLFNSARSLINGDFTTPSLTAGLFALFGAIVMYLVYVYNARLAKRTHSIALRAASKDNLSDALVSLGTAVGVLFSTIGLAFIDAALAVIIAFIIIKTAVEIFLDTVVHLSDGFAPELVDRYASAVLAIEGVEEVRDVKARHLGNRILVDMTIAVSGNLTVSQAHALSDEVEEMLADKHRVSYTHVHVEPVDH